MKISPSYDAEPIIELDGPADAVGVPLVRQRRRLAEAATKLAPDQWEASTRCDNWTVKDAAWIVSGLPEVFETDR